MADNAGALQWLQSPWDHNVHAFAALGEVASEAICTHCAPTSRLIEPLAGAKKCLGCLYLHGNDLAGQGEATWR